ncbi:MAG: Mce-associated membrane protein [Myxococcota bacterium]|jgi:Mce-associated membrane protein
MNLPLPHNEVVVSPSWRRGLALLVDALPLATLWLLLAGAIAAASPSEAPSVPWNLLDTVVDYIHARPKVVLLAGVAAVLLLFMVPLVAHLALGRTPGKRLLGLAVVDRQGQPISRSRAIVHCALRVFSVVLVLGGYIWALADPQRRTLHDRLAGVYVIQAEGALKGRPMVVQQGPDAGDDAV